MKKYSIELREEQRHALKQILSKGVAPARQIKHAHILLKADSSEEGSAWSDEQIQEAFGVGLSTIVRVQWRFVEHGLEQAQQRVGAWQQQRDHAQATIDWRFTTADARSKLKHLYPSFN